MTKTEAHSPSILVIDDQEGIRKSFSAVLEKEGYEVDAVATGQEAIKRTKSRFYNLALVDLRLPDMDGIELLTKMRETTPKMVKIIITGYPSIKNAIAAVNRGADGYIVKPFTMKDALKMIKEHLRKQQEAVKYSEKKVKEFIETRAEEYESKATTKHRSKK